MTRLIACSPCIRKIKAIPKPTHRWLPTINWHGIFKGSNWRFSSCIRPRIQSFAYSLWPSNKRKPICSIKTTGSGERALTSRTIQSPSICTCNCTAFRYAGPSVVKTLRSFNAKIMHELRTIYPLLVAQILFVNFGDALHRASWFEFHYSTDILFLITLVML